jgi:RimJ/RimL family protein N-acetyltransferase
MRREVVVETPRLVLRMYGRRDRETLHRMLADPEMFHFSHRGPMSHEESWSMLLRHVGHWQICGYGVFAVVEKESGRVIGEAGVCDFQRRLGADFDDFPEITWSIDTAFQGRGYATEAAAAALGWLEREYGKKQTVCLIHEDNAASIAVAEKLGYRRFTRCPYRNYTALLMRRGEDTRSMD